MTDRDKFIQTFDKLHASPDVLTEVLEMTTDTKVVSIRKRSVMRKAIAIVATLVVVIGMCSFAYAKDIGGIQRTVQVWINGEQTNAVCTVDENGVYQVEFEDEEGITVDRSGGDVVIEFGE